MFALQIFVFIFFMVFGDIFALGNCTLQEYIPEVWPREMPNTTPYVINEFNIEDFGAIADDNGDDYPAFEAALHHLMKFPYHSRLKFSRGVYNLHPPENVSSIFPLENMEDIVLDGLGAEIVIHMPVSNFVRTYQSKNILIKNFSIDYDPLPFSQTRVESINHLLNEIIVKVEIGFPELDAPHFINSKTWDGGIKKGILKDPLLVTALKYDTPNSFSIFNVTRLSQGRYRLKLGAFQTRHFTRGDPFVFLARGGPAVFDSSNSHNVTFTGLTIYSSSGTAFLSGGSTLTNLIGNSVVPKAGRWQSVDADGLIVFRNRIGPWIENNIFSAVGDDSININTPAAVVIALDGDKTQITGRINHLGNRQQISVEINDQYRLFDPSSGAMLGQFKVVAAKVLSNNIFEVMWNHPLPKNVVLEKKENPTIFYNQQTSGSNFVVKNNSFLHTRRYGVLAQSHNGVIANNYFNRTSGNAILLMNTIHSGSGFVPHDITIANNCIIDSYTQSVVDRGANHAAIIASIVEKNNYQRAKFKGIENIDIINNRIYNWRKVPAIWMQNTVNLAILGNHFTTDQKLRTNPLGNPPAIKIEFSHNYNLDNNVINDHRQSEEKATELEPSSPL